MPTNALNFISDQERERIEDTIAESEKQTSAEIVCAIATESGRYDRAESIIGIAFAVLLLTLANVASWTTSTADWGPPDGPSLLFQVIAVTVGFVVGLVVASYAHGLRRLVVSSAEMEAESTRAASHVFTEQKMGLTNSRGGLLIYVSLFEREVVILADQASFQAIQAEGLNRLQSIATSELKAGKRERAFTETIRASLNMLKTKLPAVEGAGNELSNLVVRIHPRP